MSNSLKDRINGLIHNEACRQLAINIVKDLIEDDNVSSSVKDKICRLSQLLNLEPYVETELGMAIHNAVRTEMEKMNGK